MVAENNNYGLVVCGGWSSRMGIDKGLIRYHEKSQQYHVYDMVARLSEETFISCNHFQAGCIDSDYKTMVDLPVYASIGPMAALLTAFTHHPDRDFLVIGCDYPLVNTEVLKDFLMSIEEDTVAAAFYNEQQELYEPLLAWYSHHTSMPLLKMFKEKQYSLQYLLREMNAKKFYPADDECMKSIDTPLQALDMKSVLQKRATITLVHG